MSHFHHSDRSWRRKTTIKYRSCDTWMNDEWTLSHQRQPPKFVKNQRLCCSAGYRPVTWQGLNKQMASPYRSALWSFVIGAYRSVAAVNDNKWTQSNWGGTWQQTRFFIRAHGSDLSLCGLVVNWPLTVTLKEKPQIYQQKDATKKLSTYLPGSSTLVVTEPGCSLLSQKEVTFTQTSSCIFYCYILSWSGIPALLKWNHLNPVGPAFVIAEGFSTGTIGGVLYTLTLDWSHYLCFTCSPPSLFRVCNKESSLLSPTGGVVCTCTIR